jgi:hypothetical protein
LADKLVRYPGDREKEERMRSARFEAVYLFCAGLGVAALLSGCAVTTASLEASSETLVNTAEASTDVTASTSPRGERAAKDEATLEYARRSFERLKADMAFGGGEHLASLGSLLGVPAPRQGEFFSLTRERFSALAGPEVKSAEELVANLDAELTRNPQLRR